MTATVELSPAATQWQIDPAHTHVEFAVKHLMISTVKGRFGDVAGVVSGDLLNPAAASLDVTLGVASIDTRQEQRDAHLRSPDFFDSMKWPTIRFVGKEGERRPPRRLLPHRRSYDPARHARSHAGSNE